MTTENARSEIRQQLDSWTERNLELERMIQSKGAQLSPVTFLVTRLNTLIDTLIGPIDDTDPDNVRVAWEVALAKITNGWLTSANQEVDAEIAKIKLTQGVGQAAQQLHLPR